MKMDSPVAPGRALKLLDAADLVALLRSGLPSIADLFADFFVAGLRRGSA